MNEKMNKKQLTLTIVAVVTLIALVAGATYAYFAVGVNTEGFTTQNINANAESVGNVILTKTGNGIYLNLSRVNMMKQGSTYQYDCVDPNPGGKGNYEEKKPTISTLEKYSNDIKLSKTARACEGTGLVSATPTCDSGCVVANKTLIGEDVTYYGVDTPTGAPVITMNRIPIGTASVTGEGNYTCTYSLTVTNANSSAANNMYTAFQEWKTNGYKENNVEVSPSSDATTGQIVLNVGGTEYDFYTANVFNTKATGTLSNITSTSSKTIEAYMYVKNDGNKNQNAIAGTEINIEVTVDSFSCTAVEAPVLTSRTEYWTYEGTNVTYASASPKYTEAQKSQIPNNYYVKSIVTPTVAIDDIYEVQIIVPGQSEAIHFGLYEGIDACETNKGPGNCVKLYSSGETYDVPTNEVCGKFNSEVCLPFNNWENASEMMASMKAAGATYCYEETYQSDSQLICSNEPLENGHAATGSLYCRTDNDGGVYCGLNGRAECDFDSLGNAGCYGE